MNREIIQDMVKIAVNSEMRKIIDLKEELQKQNTSVPVKIKKVDEGIDTVYPEYKTIGSSGMDVCSIEDVILVGGGTTMIGTNLSFELPKHVELQVRSRSGLAAKYGIFVLNSPGTIDSDYRGELKIILHNTSDKDFDISKGDRIAQIIVSKVSKMQLEFTDELSFTKRGSGGFGSTGVNDGDVVEKLYQDKK